MKFIILSAVIMISIVGCFKYSYAEQTNFNQRILPIDCIFEVVDTGTQELRFLTPSTCPVDPIIEEPSVSTNKPSNLQQSSYYYLSPITLEPETPENAKKTLGMQKDKKIKDIIIRISDDIIAVSVLMGIFLGVYMFLKRKKSIR